MAKEDDNRLITPVAPASGSRILGMEGLRGVAAVTVLIGHVSVYLARDVDKGAADPAFEVMGQGLTLFFALSGFLLYRSFAAAIATGRSFPRVGRYFENRGLRIFPAYVVILLLVSLVFGVANQNPPSPDTGSDWANSEAGFMTDPTKLITNILMIHTLFPATIKTGLGVSWSLTVELLFYLVLPAIAFLAYRLRSTRIPTTVITLAPAAFVLFLGLGGKAVVATISNPISANERFYLEWGSSWTAVLARSFFAHADLFAFGMVAAALVALFQESALAPRHEFWVRWGGVVAGIAAIMVLRGTIVENTAYAALAGAVIFFVATPSGAPGAAARVLDLLPFRYLGEVSYSMYLWHVPVISMLVRHGFVFPATLPGFYSNVALVLFMSVAMSTLTYYAIERKALQFKRDPAPVMARRP
ncbi:acyltransferase family protein [Actinomycetes bacterium M1A6_2h]